ncbi:MAG: hypothetical protein WBX03_17095, partial [Terriglobales bacterium]
MQASSMLINGGGCLCAAVAIGVVEIESGDTVLAESAGEGDAAVRRFRGVISHTFIVVLLTAAGFGQWVCDLST